MGDTYVVEPLLWLLSPFLLTAAVFAAWWWGVERPNDSEPGWKRREQQERLDRMAAALSESRT